MKTINSFFSAHNSAIELSKEVGTAVIILKNNYFYVTPKVEDALGTFTLVSVYENGEQISVDC